MTYKISGLMQHYCHRIMLLEIKGFNYKGHRIGITDRIAIAIISTVITPAAKTNPQLGHSIVSKHSF